MFEGIKNDLKSLKSLKSGLELCISTCFFSLHLTHFLALTIATVVGSVVAGVALAEQLQGHVKEAFVSPHANHVLQPLAIRCGEWRER